MKRSVFAAAATAVALVVGTPAIPQAQEQVREVVVKLWSRADRSGPLRAGNIVAAADVLNRMLAASGSDTRVKVEVFENNAKGYDADALDLLKAFAVGKGPDLYVAAHEWIGAFVEAGYAWNLEDHIKNNPEFYSDIIETLWKSVEYKGQRYGVPQDTEVRMFFYNKDMLRKIGKSEEFIEGLPGMVERGEFTIYDLTDLAKEVVDKGAAKYGLVHRPNVGPDFQMVMGSFGFDPYDEANAKLQASRKALRAFYDWLKYSVDAGVIPANMTSWSWDSVHASFRSEQTAFLKLHGIWNVPPQMKARGFKTPEEYFRAIGWIHSPPAEKGGKPSNLSHPIIYVVNPKSEVRELAAMLVAIASQPYFNTEHAVTTGHLPISYGQVAMKRFVEEGWALRAATPMLKYTSFMPNHAKVGQFNAIIYKGIQAVETGRLTPEDATAFVLDELQNELGDEVVIIE